jgi:hypothetical protein
MENKVINEVKLSDGRIVTKNNPRVRDLANAEAQAKGKEHLIKYALLSAKIKIDNKPAVLEDVLDMSEDELIQVGELFDPLDEKNA